MCACVRKRQTRLEVTALALCGNSCIVMLSQRVTSSTRHNEIYRTTKMIGRQLLQCNEVRMRRQFIAGGGGTATNSVHRLYRHVRNKQYSVISEYSTAHYNITFSSKYANFVSLRVPICIMCGVHQPMAGLHTRLCLCVLRERVYILRAWAIFVFLKNTPVSIRQKLQQKQEQKQEQKQKYMQLTRQTNVTWSLLSRRDHVEIDKDRIETEIGLRQMQRGSF